MDHIKDLSDGDLLARLKQSDHHQRNEVLLTLYERYKYLVLKICYYHLADYDESNDVFHEVFIKVIENAENIKNPASFRSWLMSITRNLCVDRLRRTSYLVIAKEKPAEIEIANEARVEDRYIAEMDRQKIQRQLSSCIGNLEPRQLNVFQLRWQGLQAGQITKALKIERAELRRHYDQIKKILESCMQKHGFELSIDQILLLGDIDEG